MGSSPVTPGRTPRAMRTSGSSGAISESTMVNSQSLSLKTAEAGFTGTFTRSSALWRSRTKNQRHQSRQRLPLNSSVPGSTASGGRRSSSIRCRSSPPEQRNAGCCGSMTSSGTHSCRASLKTRPFPFPRIRSALLCRRIYPTVSPKLSSPTPSPTSRRTATGQSSR